MAKKSFTLPKHSNGVDERSKCKHATIKQQLTALWSNGIQASSDWQYSSPMMLGIQWGRQSYFRVTVPLFITTLLKCSASMCAHWRPFSWWRPRPPPSSPVPINSTNHTPLLFGGFVFKRATHGIRCSSIFLFINYFRTFYSSKNPEKNVSQFRQIYSAAQIFSTLIVLRNVS